MAEGKRPFLKKGAGIARFLQRSVALNPPLSPLTAAAAAEISSSENAQTSTQSLPLIENLSPITKEPALNIRPTTAETGDSGVRDINLQISPSNDSGSVRTTVTTYNRKSPPKAPAETNVNESEGENLAQQYVQINPTSARLIEKHGPELISGSSSRTNSYTSLDRIKTPPIGNHTKENESSELLSNNSAEIYAPSRSKGSTSVGTSAAHDLSHETENNDYNEVVHDSSGANKPSRLDSSLQFNGILNHNNSLPPPTQYQYHDDTPLNSKRHGPLFKSHSSSSLLYEHRRKPQSYFGQTARRFGILPVHKYVLPPRPKILESPDVVNGLGTPQASSTKNNIFCNTPMLSENFVKNEDGKIVESLAEQLRALLVCIDVGMDERRLRVKRLKFIYDEKARALQRKEQEMKERMTAEENKLIGGKAKLKLEFDKMKGTDETLKNLQNELKDVKRKNVETSTTLSVCRTAKNQIEQKLKKTEEELKEAREKAMKWESLNIKLKNELDLERMKNQFFAKHPHTAQPHVFAPPQQQSRQPLRQLSQQQRQYERPTPSAQEVTPPFILQRQPARQEQQQLPSQRQQPPQRQQQQGQQLPPRRLTNTSTSSVASSSKNVHWGSPIAEHRSISGNSENFNFSSLQIYIPEDVDPTNTIPTPDFIEKQYSEFGCYRIMNECKCESIRYDNGDLQYCCLTDVNVNFCYFDENGQLTVTLAGGFIINTFRSKQLEIHRTATNEKSIVQPNGTRFEYFNVVNEEKQAVEMFDKNGGQRKNPDGSVVTLEDMNTIRDENDTVEQDDSRILFCCLGFRITRSLDKNLGGGVTIRVLNNESNKDWKITVCPEHSVFYVKHYNGDQEKRCFYTGLPCEHLKN